MLVPSKFCSFECPLTINVLKIFPIFIGTCDPLASLVGACVGTPGCALACENLDLCTPEHNWLDPFEPVRADDDLFDHLRLHTEFVLPQQIAQTLAVYEINSDRTVPRSFF